MTLSDIGKALSKLNPPYSESLLISLEKDGRAGARKLLRRLQSRQRAEQRTRKRVARMLRHEQQARAEGFRLIAGVDEVGRGPLAGPVVAAAVILLSEVGLPEINDSKSLSDAQRRKAFRIIAATADIGIGVVSVKEIDRLNIYRANALAMKLAIEDLASVPDMVLVDGRPIREIDFPQRAIVKGDKLSLSIAAASIVAKVVRDEMMLEFDKKYPAYNFGKHKGYGTAEHMEIIRRAGICPMGTLDTSRSTPRRGWRATSTIRSRPRPPSTATC